MKRSIGAVGIGLMLVLLAAQSALAGAKCQKHPEAERMKESELKARLENEGYKIKKFKIDGNCYEIYGWNQAGQKVEIYFDMKDGSVVKSKKY